MESSTAGAHDALSCAIPALELTWMALGNRLRLVDAWLTCHACSLRLSTSGKDVFIVLLDARGSSREGLVLNPLGTYCEPRYEAPGKVLWHWCPPGSWAFVFLAIGP